MGSSFPSKKAFSASRKWCGMTAAGAVAVRLCVARTAAVCWVNVGRGWGRTPVWTWDGAGSVQRLGGEGMQQICPRFGRCRHENSPYRGHICPTPWWNELDSGQACRQCRGSCSPIPGSGCFGDLLEDGIVVSPSSPIVEQLAGAFISWPDAI